MSDAVLEVRGLHVAHGAKVALDGLDLTVNRGDLYGLVGPIGCGKSTALACAVGYLTPDRGQVRILGDAPSRESRLAVGALIRRPAFDRWLSPRKTLVADAGLGGMGRSDALARADRVLEQLRLMDVSDVRSRRLTPSQSRRLGIARALVREPPIVVLDDAFRDLSADEIRWLQELLADLVAMGTTVVLSSGEFEPVRALCTRVGMMDVGRMGAEGPPSELLEGRDDGRVVELAATDMAALFQALSAMDDVELLGPGDHDRERVRVSPELAFSELNRRLMDAGVAVEALVPSVHQLEDLFLDVTR